MIDPWYGSSHVTLVVVAGWRLPVKAVLRLRSTYFQERAPCRRTRWHAFPRLRRRPLGARARCARASPPRLRRCGRVRREAPSGPSGHARAFRSGGPKRQVVERWLRGRLAMSQRARRALRSPTRRRRHPPSLARFSRALPCPWRWSRSRSRSLSSPGCRPSVGSMPRRSWA